MIACFVLNEGREVPTLSGALLSCWIFWMSDILYQTKFSEPQDRFHRTLLSGFGNELYGAKQIAGICDCDCRHSSFSASATMAGGDGIPFKIVTGCGCEGVQSP